MPLIVLPITACGLAKGNEPESTQSSIQLPISEKYKGQRDMGKGTMSTQSAKSTAANSTVLLCSTNKLYWNEGEVHISWKTIKSHYHFLNGQNEIIACRNKLLGNNTTLLKLWRAGWWLLSMGGKEGVGGVSGVGGKALFLVLGSVGLITIRLIKAVFKNLSYNLFYNKKIF